MWTLTLWLGWVLTGPIAEIDTHPMFVDTMSGQIHLTGFASQADCMAYQYSFPVALNGVPQPYTITSKRCHRSHASGRGAPSAGNDPESTPDPTASTASD